jgi:protein-S-isoprenylcysteine O-methyltransferase Ste14
MGCPFTPPVYNNDNDVNYYWPSYYVSRVNFVLVHLFTVFYWFPFLFNNPLNFPFVNTIDAKAEDILPAGQCTEFDEDAAKNNLFLFFGVWWFTHSGLSRRVVKQFLGLWEHPFDRPLFGIVACISLPAWTHFWQPLTNCARWNVLDTPLPVAAASAAVIAFCLVLILGFFWTMPDHVFGTSRHKVLKVQPKPELFTQFPYGMVRHPAATGFLWLFWALPSYTTNHIFYSACWTLFIVVGTSFEEGGLRSNLGDFGPVYEKYASQVGMFFPNLRWFSGHPVRMD